MSTTTKFTLGLDLDGVCADYTGEFRRFVSRFTGQPETALPDPTSWSLADSGWGITDDDYLTLHERAVDQGMFRSMPAMPGVSQALWKLSDDDIHIRVVTHRLIRNKQHHTVAADTATWLDSHNIPYRDLCFLGAKSEVNADVFIDDAPHNIVALREAGRDVIIFDHAYNRHLDGVRAHTWEHAYELISQKAAAANAT